MSLRHESMNGYFAQFDRYGNLLAERTGKELLLPVTAGEVINLSLSHISGLKLTTDYEEWHRYFFTQQSLLEATAPELLQGLTFDPDQRIPWSPELSKLLTIMWKKGTLIERGSVAEGLFFEIPEQTQTVIKDDLEWRYTSYVSEIGRISSGIRDNLGIH